MRCGVLKVIRLSTTLVKCILYNKAKKKTNTVELWLMHLKKTILIGFKRCAGV